MVFKVSAANENPTKNITKDLRNLKFEEKNKLKICLEGGVKVTTKVKICRFFLKIFIQHTEKKLLIKTCLKFLLLM